MVAGSPWRGLCSSSSHAARDRFGPVNIRTTGRRERIKAPV
jgi:hypothetical protein